MAEEMFGERLYRYRKEHYLTQKQLAQMIGVSANHIGTLERGKKKPRASTVAAFEDAIKENRRKIWNDAGNEGGLDEEELQVYDQIWQRLICLEPEREKAALETLFYMLRWR